MAKIDFVFEDSDESLLVADCQPCDASNPMLTKALALLKGLKRARQERHNNVLVKTNALNLIRFVKGTMEVLGFLFIPIILDIREFVLLLPIVKFFFILREPNIKAGEFRSEEKLGAPIYGV